MRFPPRCKARPMLNDLLEDDMKIRVPAMALAAASLIAVAGCDSRDYEAELATLQTDLESAQSENEQMQTELEELRAQSGTMPEGGLETATTELNTAVQTAATTFERMGSMTEEPDAPAEQRTEALGVLREDMQKIVQSVQAAAQGLGIELETVAMDTDAGASEGQPEPAAGPADQPQDEPAATPEQPPAEGAQEPAEGAQEPPSQPAQ